MAKKNLPSATKLPNQKKFNELNQDQQRFIVNGLASSILGFDPGGFGTPVNQVDGIFVNMRWYLISNMRQPLSQAYTEIGVVKTVVDVPVEDAFRGGVDFHSGELDADDIMELQNKIESEGDLTKASDCARWNRLFGGSGLLINTGQDYKTPLDMERIAKGQKKLGFKDADMWELYWDKQNVDGDGEPLENPDNEFFRFYGKNVHKSRVLTMRGIRAPSFIRPRLRGWGLSVVEVMVNSVNQYLKSANLVYEVLDEFKVDIFKIKNLNSSILSKQGQQKIMERTKIANYQKNFQHAITMDAEDDYAQKQLSFTGLAEAQVGIRMQVASDLRMPLTKVFGISAAGFSSGEDDIENYNAMVESSVRTPMKRHISTIAKLRCMQLFGFVPKDLRVEFKPLRILSSEQEENVKTQKSTRIVSFFTSGLISQKDALDAINKGKLLDVQIDTSSASIEIGQDDEDEGEAGPLAATKGKKSATQPKDAKEAKE